MYYVKPLHCRCLEFVTDKFYFLILFVYHISFNKYNSICFVYLTSRYPLWSSQKACKLGLNASMGQENRQHCVMDSQLSLYSGDILPSFDFQHESFHAG